MPACVFDDSMVQEKYKLAGFYPVDASNNINTVGRCKA